MGLIGWIGKTSGLPTFIADGPGDIVAGGRVLARLPEGRFMLADVLAQPGEPVTYTLGGDAVTLERPASEEWAAVHVADGSGRSPAGVFMDGNQDPLSWESTMSRHDTGAVRWSLHDKPTTGTYVLTAPTGVEGELWRVLRAREPVTVTPLAPTDGVPARVILVDGVSRKRVVDSLMEFSVTWTEATGSADTWAARVPGGGLGAVPAVTWGEWDKHNAGAGTPGWRHGTAEEIARAIQGAP